MNLDLHPKMKAVGSALGVIVLLDAAAYFDGRVSLHAFVMTAGSGACMFLAGYLKKDTSTLELGLPEDG